MSFPGNSHESQGSSALFPRRRNKKTEKKGFFFCMADCPQKAYVLCGQGNADGVIGHKKKISGSMARGGFAFGGGKCEV